jgi:hypothetical protein
MTAHSCIKLLSLQLKMHAADRVVSGTPKLNLVSLMFQGQVPLAIIRCALVSLLHCHQANCQACQSQK